jgi:predicted alpha/beta-fold hydrolase
MPIFTAENWPAEYPPFAPRPWLRNTHLQTVLGNFLPRTNQLPAPLAELVEVSPARGSQISSRVLCECHWQPPAVRSSRHTVLLLHGLEGSSHSQYVIGNANKLWRAGCNVVRMNMRNCGPRSYKHIDPQKLTPTLYHSGLSADVDHVLRHFLTTQSLPSISLIGYSMGGNIVLKLAGELGKDAPPQLTAVVAVSPAADLAASADALHEPANRIYELKFLHALLKRFRRKTHLFPRAFDPNRALAVGSLRQFDDRITALYSGFRSADDYYFRASASRVLSQIAVPTLVLHSDDDPFIRLTPDTRSTIASNPHITLLETAHGGHCAFLGPSTSAHDGYWAEHTALRFLLKQRREE